MKGTSSSDLVSLIVTMRGGIFPVIGFLLLLVSTWSSADNNVYSAGLALSKLFNMPKYIFTIIPVLIGAAVCATGVYANLSAYLGVLAMLMPPIGMIIAIDYFYIRRDIKNKMDCVGGFHWPAIIAWFISIVVDFFTGNPLGALPYRAIGVSGINSLVVGAAAYLILSKGMPQKAETGYPGKTGCLLP